MTTKKATQRQGFKTSEFIVYPAHGVGQIVAIEEQEVAGAKLELFVINFVKDKMTLRVPTAKVASVGMRKLAEGALVKRALETLKGRARVKRTMWSRRAQEYEAKINSGDIVAIAEVVRDLFRSDTQPEQSYSERQLYEAALDRLSREIAAVQRITETEAIKEIEAALAKGPRRGPPSRPRKSWSRTRRRKPPIVRNRISKARRRRRAFCISALISCSVPLIVRRTVFVAGHVPVNTPKWLSRQGTSRPAAKISRSSHIVAPIVGDGRGFGRSQTGVCV